jgi:hypothetical protein
MMGDRNGSEDFMHPDFEPGEFDLLERRLRRALHEEAELMHPSDRLEDILDAGTAEEGTPMGRRNGPPRWLAPVAAAAAAVLIAGTAWALTQRDAGPVPPAVTTAPTPTDSPTAEPSPTATTPSPTSTAAEAALLPVYYVGPIGDDKPTYRLFREFLRGSTPATAREEQKALEALRLATDAQRFSNTDGYLQPWSGTEVTAVSVTPELITVSLSNDGPDGFEREQQRLAVQQLVWTAQAAVNKGTIPVRFQIEDGSTAMYGTFPTSQTYDRPPKDEHWRDLAPIWVTSPGRDQVLDAGKPVTVTGEATVFEANVRWELKQGPSVVKEGHTTASVGAPGRGEFTIELGTLRPGDYAIRVFEMSMDDGDKVSAERLMPFSVK